MTSGQKILLGLGLGALGYAIYSYMSKSEAKAAQSRLPSSGAGALPAMPMETYGSVVSQYKPVWDAKNREWVITGNVKNASGQVVTRSVGVAGVAERLPSQAEMLAALLRPSPATSFEL